MSIKLMSAIFETEFPADFIYEKNGEKRTAKASTAKLILLAIADHCNDDGIAYPGLKRLERKTALSHHTVIDTIEAMEYNGIISVLERNEKHNTNTYQINVRCFSEYSKELPINIYNAVVQPLHQGSAVVAPEVVQQLHYNHQLTTNNHNAKVSKKATLTQKDYNDTDNQIRDMVSYSRKAKDRTDTLLPEQYQDYAKAFTDATGIVYLPNQQSKWIGAFEMWNSLGVKVEDIKRAVTQLNGYTVSSPMSLTNTLNTLIAERKTIGAADPYAKINWLDYVPDDLKG